MRQKELDKALKRILESQPDFSTERQVAPFVFAFCGPQA
jgi:hypothetical protein